MLILFDFCEIMSYNIRKILIPSKLKEFYMKKHFRQHHLSFDALTLANLVIGIILTINPKFSTTAICVVLGCACIIWACKSIYNYFSAKKNGYTSVSDCLCAYAGIFLGIFFLTGIKFIVSLLPLIIGFAIVFQSISKIRCALYRKKAGTEKWLFPLILNIIGLITGFFLIYNPFNTMLNILRLLGIVLFINGISRIFNDYLFTGEMKKAQKDDIIDVSFTEADVYIPELKE